MIMTKEIAESELRSLQILVKLADNNIDMHLTTLSYFMKAGFEQQRIDWAKGLVAEAKQQKEQLLADIEVKKSVITFL